MNKHLIPHHRTELGSVLMLFESSFTGFNALRMENCSSSIVKFNILNFTESSLTRCCCLTLGAIVRCRYEI